MKLNADVDIDSYVVKAVMGYQF